MKALISSDGFKTELWSWAWRGVLCAGPSAVWAAVSGFTHPCEIVAMLLGVGCYVFAFAAGSTWLTFQTTPGRARLSGALKTAAGIKAVSLVGMVAWWTLSVGFVHKGLDWLFLLGWPDLMLGVGNLELVGWLTDRGDSVGLARLDSFWLTALATLLQGALLSVLLAVLALVVLGVQGGWRRMTGDRILPATN